jgi:alpha-tubulin suppressor-like RCC1 family protein
MRSVALGSEGKVWTVGKNDYGHLGSGPLLPYSALFSHVSVGAAPIERITANYDSTFAVNSQGEVCTTEYTPTSSHALAFICT